MNETENIKDKPIIKRMKAEEELIMSELENVAPGSATREDLLNELSKIQSIRIKEEESEVNCVNDFINRVSQEKRLEIEDAKSKREFIAKLVGTGATCVLTVIVLSFEEKGFIRSKVFGWIKPKV